MGSYFKAIDRFAAVLTRKVIEYRWLVIASDSFHNLMSTDTAGVKWVCHLYHLLNVRVYSEYIIFTVG